MTNQEKKAYLNRYKDHGQAVKRAQEEITRLRSLAEKVTTGSSGMPGGGSADDKLQLSVERIIRAEQELLQEINEHLRIRSEIVQAITTVQDERLRLLLYYRYIDGMTFERIAVEMNYSYMQICRLHGKALTQIML